MKQKAVIKVCMHSQKSRSKAMKITVAASGVDSAAIKGEEKNLIEVKGDGMDLIDITKLLRKKLRFAELVSVGGVAVDGGGGNRGSGSDPPTNAPVLPAPPPLSTAQWPLPSEVEVIDVEYGYPIYYHTCSIL